MAELVLGRPLFPGNSGVDQLVEIIKILGTPTREQIRSMNPNYTEFRFPSIKAHPWAKVFRSKASAELLEIIAVLLEYTPATRLTSVEAMAHSFFDELRQPETKTFGNGNQPLPPLFNFTQMELSIRPDLLKKLVPSHAEQELLSRGIDINQFTPVSIQKGLGAE